ncbi:MAG: hypothetical protein AAGJ73_16535 [Pseudomonadota bacterium]
MHRHAALLALASIALSACANYGPDDFAVDAACGARESLCVADCDAAFEVAQNSWDYASCVDRCRASAGSACAPGDDLR